MEDLSDFLMPSSIPSHTKTQTSYVFNSQTNKNQNLQSVQQSANDFLESKHQSSFFRVPVIFFHSTFLCVKASTFHHIFRRTSIFADVHSIINIDRRQTLDTLFDFHHTQHHSFLSSLSSFFVHSRVFYRTTAPSTSSSHHHRFLYFSLFRQQIFFTPFCLA